jgi:hypothetical protein
MKGNRERERGMSLPSVGYFSTQIKNWWKSIGYQKVKNSIYFYKLIYLFLVTYLLFEKSCENSSKFLHATIFS